MPLAFVYAIILVLLGVLRLIVPAWHGLLGVLAEISAIMLVFWAIVELWPSRQQSRSR